MPRLPDPGDQPPPSRPTADRPADLGFTRRSRVRWLAPDLLARTGVRVAVSEVFGEYADQRERQRAASGDPLDLSGHPTTPPMPGAIDLPDPSGEPFWLDYVADLGDGFDATTTVASRLAADELRLVSPGEPGQAHVTRAGSLLVFGGDEVYPVASAPNYTDRMAGPYRMMLPWTERPRWLVALPGNHDWYDGLTSFPRQFCQGRWIGGWCTAQTRSYFAVRLPGGWWLWGIDVALGNDIDTPQLDYFRSIAQKVAKDDAIILCWAMPSWVKAGPENPEGYAPLEYFERTVIPDRAMLRLSLSGDLHHYARYQGLDPAGQQKITAGGGGAYLYPTHHLPQALSLPPSESEDPGKRPPVPYRLQRCYPSRETSRRLRGAVLWRIFGNPGFPLVPALLYLVIGTSVSQAFPLLGLRDWWLPRAPALLLAVALVALLWFGLGRFTGEATRRHPVRRWLISGAHMLVHLVLMVAIAVGVRLGLVQAGWTDIAADRPPWVQVVAALAGPLAVPVVEGLVGALVGTLLVALYLVLADRFGPGVNADELFSAQAIGDFKCFLRMRIDPDGTLTVFPVKIEKAVRWRFAGGREDGDDRRWFRPADGVEPVAELIEEPIVVTPRAPSAQPYPPSRG